MPPQRPGSSEGPALRALRGAFAGANPIEKASQIAAGPEAPVDMNTPIMDPAPPAPPKWPLDWANPAAPVPYGQPFQMTPNTKFLGKLRGK